MIRISEAFNCIGLNGCSDVATSLMMQGCGPDIDIPIYGVLNLHIESGTNAGRAANSIQEYNALRRLGMYCGAVTFTINIEGIQLLSLANALLIFTPSCGMVVFLKILDLDINSIEMEMVNIILEAAGIPIPDFIEQAVGMLNDAIQIIFNKLIEYIQEDLAEFGITLYPWDELWEFYNDLKVSGEMNNMLQTRQMMGAFTM